MGIEISGVQYHPVITKVFPNSTLHDKIKVGDILVSVENENVAGMKLANIEKILGSKRESFRRMVVLRKDNGYGFIENTRTNNVSRKYSKYNGRNPILYSQKTQSLEINVAQGRLGIQLKKADDGKTIRVSDIDPLGKLCDLVRIGDVLLSIDDDEVTDMDLLVVSKYFMQKTKETRKLTLLRTLPSEQ